MSITVLLPISPCPSWWVKCLHSMTASNYTELHCCRLNITALPCMPCSALHCPTLSYTVLYSPALHFPALPCTTLHCPALHCLTLPCTALHCPVLPARESSRRDDGLLDKIVAELISSWLFIMHPARPKAGHRRRRWTGEAGRGA